MQIDGEVHTTFFDDLNSGFSFEFTTPKPKHLKDLSTDPIISDDLICEIPLRNLTQRGTFALHNQTLAFYRANNAEMPYIILELDFSILEIRYPDDMNPDYGFRVTRDGSYIDFYAPSKDIIEKWVVKLRNICTLISFHEDYKVTKKLGKGSFATVYMGESRLDKKTYAIKVFKKKKIEAQPARAEKLKLSIMNEITVMRSMNHDGVVRLYEVYETKTSLCLVVQLIKGKTLQSVLKKSFFQKKLSQSKIYDMMFSILSSLAYVASQGIMHRDLKPGNILIDSNEKIYIGDFGLATFIKKPKYLFKRCGTPGYMAPEILSEKQSTPASDVFSMGIILYACLTGEALFKGSDSGDIINKNCQVIFDKSSDKWVNLSDNAKHLILSMIEKDPYKRPAITEILKHPFFSKNQTPNINNFSSTQDEDSADLRNRRMSIEKNLAVKDDVECLTMSKAIQSLIVPMSYFDFSNTGVSQTPEFYINEMSPMESSNCGDQSPTAVRIYDSPKHAAVDTNRRFSIKLLPINKQEKPFHLQLPALPEQSEEFEASPFGDESVLKDEESPQIFRKTQTMPNAIPFTKSPFLRSNALLTHSVMRKHGTIA